MVLNQLTCFSYICIDFYEYVKYISSESSHNTLCQVSSFTPSMSVQTMNILSDAIFEIESKFDIKIHV